jgi:cob(I)alamin adenosyltransferase
MPRIYTKTGDDGTTGLLYGGRVPKDDLVTEAYGTTDEAVAVLGLARSLTTDEVMAASCSWWGPTSPPIPRNAGS